MPASNEQSKIESASLMYPTVVILLNVVFSYYRYVNGQCARGQLCSLVCVLMTIGITTQTESGKGGLLAAVSIHRVAMLSLLNHEMYDMI